MFIHALLCASLLLAAAMPGVAAPLAGEQWNKRVVLAFADGPNAELDRQRRDLLADREALAERDMLILEVVGGTVTALYGTAAGKPSADALRSAFGVSAETPFTVILVGKDGGEKLRRTAPVAARDVIGLIDSMPMRRSEAGGN